MILFDDAKEDEGGGTPNPGAQDILDQAPAADVTPADDVTKGDTDEPSATATSLTKEDITEILKEAGLTRTSADVSHRSTSGDTSAQPPQMSQEELEQVLRVWKPDAALLQQLGWQDNPNAEKALLAIRDGFIRQAATIAEFRLQQSIKELMDTHLAPLQTHVEEQRLLSLRNEFYEKYPDLEEYSELVDAVSAKLSANGMTGTKKEIFDATAKAAQQLVKKLLAQGGQQSTNGQDKTGAQQQQKPQRSRMSTLTGGGQGGGRQSAGGSNESKIPGMEVFD